MGSNEEFYANIRCMVRLQNMYYCSCALRGSSNTTAFTFYTESPFFVEIMIIFNLFRQYSAELCTLRILHDHVHADTLADREESWLQRWTPVNSHAPSTGSHKSDWKSSRLSCQQRPFSIQVLQASILSNIVNDVNGCQGEAAGLMLSKLHRQHQIHPSGT